MGHEVRCNRDCSSLVDSSPSYVVHILWEESTLELLELIKKLVIGTTSHPSARLGGPQHIICNSRENNIKSIMVIPLDPAICQMEWARRAHCMPQYFSWFNATLFSSISIIFLNSLNCESFFFIKNAAIFMKERNTTTYRGGGGEETSNLLNSGMLLKKGKYLVLDLE